MSLSVTPDIWTGGLILAASSEVLRMNSRKKGNGYIV
jgi:hypothetical protein